MTITDFLLARIGEDEAVAWLPRGLNWSTDSCYEIEDENGKCVLEVGHDGGYNFEGNVIKHFARFDPARVLAECAAKRAIIELADHALASQLEQRDASALGAKLMHNDVRRALAAVYKDHPDYEQEWA